MQVVPTVYFREKLNALTRRIESIEAAGGRCQPSDLDGIARLADAIEAEALSWETTLRREVERDSFQL